MKLSRFIEGMRDNVRHSGHGVRALPLFSVLTVLVAWLIAYSLGNAVEQRQEMALEEIRAVAIETCERENIIRESANSNLAVLEFLLQTTSDARLREASSGDFSAEKSRELEMIAVNYLVLAERIEYFELVECDR